MEELVNLAHSSIVCFNFYVNTKLIPKRGGLSDYYKANKTYLIWSSHLTHIKFKMCPGVIIIS